MDAVKLLRPEFLSGRYEEVGDGRVYMPSSKVYLGGVFEHEVIRNGQSLGVMRDNNIVVNEGLNSVLNVVFNSATQITTWYVGIFKGNYTPLATDTAANITANATEATEYDEANRQTYVESTSTAQSLTNSANKATFTINASITVYGAFLVSSNVISGTSGTLMSASRFSASRAVVDNDQLLVTYTFSAADA